MTRIVTSGRSYGSGDDVKKCGARGENLVGEKEKERLRCYQSRKYASGSQSEKSYNIVLLVTYQVGTRLYTYVCARAHIHIYTQYVWK